MPKQTLTLDNCSPDQLKALLSLALEKRANETSLPLDIATPAEIESSLAELCENQAQSGELLLTSAADAATPLDALRGIKDLAKSFLPRAENQAQSAAARLLYHAAIAAALAHHGVNISSRPIESRRSLYGDLAIVLDRGTLGEVFACAEALARDIG